MQLVCLDSLVVLKLNLAQSRLHHEQGHQCVHRILLGTPFVQDSIRPLYQDCRCKMSRYK